jgi:hypothetical protein
MAAWITNTEVQKEDAVALLTSTSTEENDGKFNQESRYQADIRRRVVSNMDQQC